MSKPKIVVEVPDVIVKPGRMVGWWSSRSKVAIFVLCVVVYVYMLLMLKVVYLKHKRLDRIALMAADTDQMLHNLEQLDQKLASEINMLETIIGEY